MDMVSREQFFLCCCCTPQGGIIITTVPALAMTYSHTPSEQVIVPLSLCLCPTAVRSFVYSKIPHLAEMKVRLYA